MVAEAAAQQGLADLISRTSRLAPDPKQAPDLDGGDLMARLADLRTRFADLVQLYPEHEQATAGDDRRHSSLLVACLIPLAVAVMFGALAEVLKRRRGVLLACGWACVSIGVVAAVIVEVTS